jgi:ethanolamine utilization cobalamin adenosyltransferase
MVRYGFVCLLLAALTWGQSSSPVPPAQKPASQTGNPGGAPPQAATQESSEAAKVPPDAAVITIKGLCSPPVSKDPALECRTQVTRAEFEKLVDTYQPNLPPRGRRQFATRYASLLAMSIKAQEMGLDKAADFQERMKLARMQVLASELNKQIQEKASEISDKEIEDYYHNNLDKFEQAELLRIYVPKAQQLPADEAKKSLSEAEQQKRTQKSEQTMKEEADKLRARAAAGEDFNKLQAEAFQVAGIKSAAPNTNMGKVRRNVLPPSQSSAMELKPGEVSPVIADQSGFFIFKLISKGTMPLDEARDEIKGLLRSQRLQQEMKSVQESTTPTLDEAYFGPEVPRAPMAPAPPPPPGKSTPPGTK